MRRQVRERVTSFVSMLAILAVHVWSLPVNAQTNQDPASSDLGASGSATNSGHAVKSSAGSRARAPIQKQILSPVIKIPGIHFSKTFPTNFSLPIYPTNVTKKAFFNSTQGPPTATATIITTDSSDLVFQWYQSACKRDNWQVKIPTDKTMSKIGKPGLRMLSAQKGKQETFIYCIPTPKKSGTTVEITWSLRQ